MGYHEVSVDGSACELVEMMLNSRAEGQIGHKVTVHYIYVVPIRTGAFNGGNIVSQSFEIGGKQGWRNDGHGSGLYQKGLPSSNPLGDLNKLSKGDLPLKST